MGIFVVKGIAGGKKGFWWKSIKLCMVLEKY
jgi:hypothetical protein